MPNYLVLYWDTTKPPNGAWVPIVGPNSDTTFTAAKGEDAMGLASLQTRQQGKYGAFNVAQVPQAYLTTSFGSPNANFTVMAKQVGTNGTNIRLRIVVAGNNTVQSVSVSGNDITLNAATDASGNPTTTGSAAVTAINGNGPAAALVTAALAPGSSGATAVSTLDWTNLDQYGAEAATVTLATVASEAPVTF